jgi:hypothetical protein
MAFDAELRTSFGPKVGVTERACGAPDISDRARECVFRTGPRSSNLGRKPDRPEPSTAAFYFALPIGRENLHLIHTGLAFLLRARASLLTLNPSFPLCDVA